MPTPLYRILLIGMFLAMPMLVEKDKLIDAVIIATPDHTHAIASMAAMRSGKHVYCEKPLTQNVQEARALRQAAARLGVATQMGNQGTASEGFRRAVEVIQAREETVEEHGQQGSFLWIVARKPGGDT